MDQLNLFLLRFIFPELSQKGGICDKFSLTVVSFYLYPTLLEKGGITLSPKKEVSGVTLEKTTEEKLNQRIRKLMERLDLEEENQLLIKFASRPIKEVFLKAVDRLSEEWTKKTLLEKIPKERVKELLIEKAHESEQKDLIRKAEFDVEILPRACPICPTKDRQMGTTSKLLNLSKSEELRINLLREGNLSSELQGLQPRHWGVECHITAINGNGVPVIRFLKSGFYFRKLSDIIVSTDI